MQSTRSHDEKRDKASTKFAPQEERERERRTNEESRHKEKEGREEKESWKKGLAVRGKPKRRTVSTALEQGEGILLEHWDGVRSWPWG